jgi:hypothetical protein
MVNMSDAKEPVAIGAEIVTIRVIAIVGEIEVETEVETEIERIGIVIAPDVKIRVEKYLRVQ